MIRATVRIECEGGFPERFLNEATASGIVLWDVTASEGSLCCSCRASDYRALRPAAKRASVRMRVREKKGIAFAVYPYRLRWGLVMGALLFVFILQGLSSRIWTVQIYGNEQVSEQEIRDVLAPLGVTEGAVFDAVDLPLVQLTALEQMPGLMWLTVNLQGSTAVVQVTERTPAKEIVSAQPANIVASRDGVVVQVDAVAGQAMVKEGDAVTEGTLLISGVMDSKVGPLLKRADGVVTARTERCVSVTVPFEETVVSETPYTVSRPCLYVMGLRIPLYTATQAREGYAERVVQHPLTVNGTALPIGVEVVEWVYETTEVRRRGVQGATAEANARLAQIVAEWGETVRIESRTVETTETADGVTLTATFVCLESIGTVQPLQIYEKTD